MPRRMMSQTSRHRPGAGGAANQAALFSDGDIVMEGGWNGGNQPPEEYRPLDTFAYGASRKEICPE
jgi:hypothetical protein